MATVKIDEGFSWAVPIALVGILLSQRYGCRIVVNIGATGCVFSFICAFFSKTILIWVCFIGGGVGVSLALIYSPIFVMIGRCFRKRVGIAMGISVAGVSVGQMVFPSIISFMIDYYGVRGALILSAGIISHFFIAGALMPRYIEDKSRPIECNLISSERKINNLNEKERHDPENKNVNNEKRNIIGTFTNIQITMLAIYITSKIFADVGDVGIAIVLPAYGKSTLGLSNQEMSLAIGISGGVDLLSRILIGIISDRPWCRRSLLLTAALFLEALNTLVFIWLPYKSCYYFCYGIFGLCSGTAITLMTVVLTDLVSQINFTISFAAMMFMSGIFIVFGQIFVGYLADKTGNFICSILFLGISLFIGCFLLSLEYPIKKIFFNTYAATDIVYVNKLSICNNEKKELGDKV